MTTPEEDDRPFVEIMQEAVFNESQPLVGIGWRLDYERRGIVRPGRFIPLADLTTARDALQGCELRGEEGFVYRDTISGVAFRLEDLWDACAAFEAHDDRQEEKRGATDGKAWAEDLSTARAAVEALSAAFRRWLNQTRDPAIPLGEFNLSHIPMESVYDFLPMEAKGQSEAYRQGFVRRIDEYVLFKERRKKGEG